MQGDSRGAGEVQVQPRTAPGRRVVSAGGEPSAEGAGEFPLQLCLRLRDRHREFFTLEPEYGRMVVSRWAQFCARAYTIVNGECQLADEWRFYLDRFRESRHGRPGPNQPQEEKDDHASRHKRWQSLLDPKKWKWSWYRHSVWANRWQLWSGLLASWFLISTLAWIPLIFFGATATGVLVEDSWRNLVKDLWRGLLEVTGYYSRGTTEDMRADKIDTRLVVDQEEMNQDDEDEEDEDDEEGE